MANNEVLLLKPVDGLGGEGDQVKVRAGYARNFLFPREIAVPVTKSNRKQVEALKARRAAREAHELSGAQELGRKLEKFRFDAFVVKTGEGGKMFGAITAADIHERLAAAGFEIERKRIHLFNPIKALGQHAVKVKLHADVTVDVSFDVVSENPIETAPAAAAEPARPEARKSEARKPEPKAAK
jgi:large subunit ribosomal protein L9